MYRFACPARYGAGRSGFARVLVWCVWCVASAASANAQDVAQSSPVDTRPAGPVTLAHASTAALAQGILAAPQVVAPLPLDGESTRRPKPLLPLYVSFASLQGMDVHSTARALDRGAVEANPLMKGIADNPLAFAAVKVAGSAGVFYAAEKMWKKNRKAAVIFMIAANAGMAFVVQHNYRAVK